MLENNKHKKLNKLNTAGARILGQTPQAPPEEVKPGPQFNLDIPELEFTADMNSRIRQHIPQVVAGLKLNIDQLRAEFTRQTGMTGQLLAVVSQRCMILEELAKVQGFTDEDFNKAYEKVKARMEAATETVQSQIESDQEKSEGGQVEVELQQEEPPAEPVEDDLDTVGEVIE